MSTTRGPCVQDYAQKLRNECQNIWENGRQKSEKEVYRGHDFVPGVSVLVSNYK